MCIPGKPLRRREPSRYGPFPASPLFPACDWLRVQGHGASKSAVGKSDSWDYLGNCRPRCACLPEMSSWKCWWCLMPYPSVWNGLSGSQLHFTWWWSPWQGATPPQQREALAACHRAYAWPYLAFLVQASRVTFATPGSDKYVSRDLGKYPKWGRWHLLSRASLISLCSSKSSDSWGLSILDRHVLFCMFSTLSSMSMDRPLSVYHGHLCL